MCSLLCDEEEAFICSGRDSPSRNDILFDDNSRDDDYDDDERQQATTATSVYFQNDAETIQMWIRKESCLMPGDLYLCRLKSDGHLRGCRLRAVQWIIQAGIQFNFKPHTIASAVNYFDRFMERNLDKPWKEWIMDLLSIGCLSVAVKQDEVRVPLLQELQASGLDHRFDSIVIQRMELALLASLDWRVNTITPFTYTEMMLQIMASLSNYISPFLSARVTELLLQSLQEFEFIEYTPSVIATSCMHSSLEEMVPMQADSLKAKLRDLLFLDEEKVESCNELTEELLVDPLLHPRRRSSSLESPPSPVAVAEVAAQSGAQSPHITRYSAVVAGSSCIKKRARSGRTITSLTTYVNSRKRRCKTCADADALLP